MFVERDDVSHGKPHPDPYLLAARRLGIPAGRAVVFDDNASGVAAASAARAYCVGIGADDLLSHGASITIPDFQSVDVRLSGGSITLVCQPGHEILTEPLPVGV